MKYIRRYCCYLFTTARQYFTLFIVGQKLFLLKMSCFRDWWSWRQNRLIHRLCIFYIIPSYHYIWLNWHWLCTWNSTSTETRVLNLAVKWINKSSIHFPWHEISTRSKSTAPKPKICLRTFVSFKCLSKEIKPPLPPAIQPYHFIAVSGQIGLIQTESFCQWMISTLGIFDYTWSFHSLVNWLERCDDHTNRNWNAACCSSVTATKQLKKKIKQERGPKWMSAFWKVLIILKVLFTCVPVFLPLHNVHYVS